MNELRDWFWSPFLDAAHVLWGVGLIAGLSAIIAAGMWSLRVPGETSPRERRNLQDVALIGERLFAAMVRAMPLLLVLGAGLIFFPVSPPTALLLSSRARLAGENDDWDERWSKTVREAGVLSGDRCLDAGLLVDEACTRINDETREVGGWRQDDPEARRRLTRIVKDVLAQTGQPTTHDPGATSHRVETRVPRWVVESVEQSILKGLMQRVNARRVAVLAADRPTDFGMAWDQAEECLHQGSPAHHTDFLIERVRADDSLRIEQVLGVVWKDDRLQVNGLVSARPSKADRSLPVHLLLKDKSTRKPIKPLTIKADDKYRLEAKEIEFERVAKKDEPTHIQQDTQPPRLVPIPKDAQDVAAGSGIKIELRVANPAAWSKTFAALKENPAFQGWRERMKNLGYKIDDIVLGDRGDVVIDALTSPGSVWVYPSGFDGERLKKMTQTVEGKEGKPYRGRLVGDSDFPGLYSWDLLPVVKQKNAPPTNGNLGAEITPLGASLESGSTRGEGADLPLVTRITEALGAAGKREVMLTHLAIDPAVQGVLVEASNYEPSRLTVFWAALLDAARRAPSAAPDAPQDQSADYPVALLDSVACNELRAEALTQNLLPLLAGLLVYALFLLRGIANAPPPR